MPRGDGVEILAEGDDMGKDGIEWVGTLQTCSSAQWNRVNDY